MLYPASHVLIVNDAPSPKITKSTLSTLDDEVAGIISSEGEVTSASTTYDSREQNQQATWGGFWQYKPPPDNAPCTKHCSSIHSELVEAGNKLNNSASITKRIRQPIHRKRLQRSAYKSHLERSKYRDDTSPVIMLPRLPIKTDKVTPVSTQIPDTKATGPLPRLKSAPKVEIPLHQMSEPFDSQPLTIECVENTACRNESAMFDCNSLTIPLSSKLYKIPSTIRRKPLPMSPYLTIQRAVNETATSTLLAKRAPAIATSPTKKMKTEPKAETVLDISPANAPSKPEREYKPERQKDFTHEADIVVNEGDLENLFESDQEEEDYSTVIGSTLVLDQNAPVVPESCLTPDNLTDPKCILSPQDQAPAQFNTQSHDYPTPPSISNDTTSYDELLQTDVKSQQCEKKCETYFQMLLNSSSYSPLNSLSKPTHPISSYSPKSNIQPTKKLIMINSPCKTSDQTSRLQEIDITAELYKISTDLRDLESLSSSPDYSRTLQMSVIKDETTLQSIGEKIIQSPDQNFVFPSTMSQAHVKKELSDLPKLQGGQFLIKFGDSHINKFLVSSEDVHIPGGYSCIASDSKSVMLDVSRMEIYAKNDHKSTVGYLPKSSISISLYQSVENRTTNSHNVNAFAVVENSRFSTSFLQVLQQLARNVDHKFENGESMEDLMTKSTCISNVGKLLETQLADRLLVPHNIHNTSLLPWDTFSSLADASSVEQPIPSVVTGSDGQWMSVSPLGLPLWLPKGMEPYGGRKDISYLVITPENPHIINNINIFFKELSAVYELCHLGRHQHLNTKIRDGIMRFGKKSGEKVFADSVDPWFVRKDDPESLTWQIYAKCCHHLLAKYLSKFLENQDADFKSIVIYLIDPFQTKCSLTKAQLITRCFNSMKEELNKIKNTQFIMQCIPVDYVSDLHKNKVNMGPSLRSICFSVYNQVLKHTTAKPLATCLTGFGPVSDDVGVLEGGDQKKQQNTIKYHINTPPVALNAKPQRDVTSQHDTLFCAYSLSHDINWVIVAVSDSAGHMTDTAVYAVDEQVRQGAVPPSVINKIWYFCLSTVETYKCMWNIVISKMGNITDQEDHVWSEYFKTSASWNSQLVERCKECNLANKVQTYGIASTCLLSVLNAPHVNVIPLLNRAKSQHICSTSHVLILPQHQHILEGSDRFKKQQDDSFTFYAGPDVREKRRKILSSAYLASSTTTGHQNVPKHMGYDKSSVLLSNLYQHSVFLSSKKQALCGDNYSSILRHIIQKFDDLSWLQVNAITRDRRSTLPLHMCTVANIYTALENATFVPP